MNELTKMIAEVITDNAKKLKIVEKEIVRKYKANEDYSEELRQAKDLKTMINTSVAFYGEKNERTIWYT